MKKIFNFLILLLLVNLYFIPSVYASGSITISASNLTLEKGNKGTFSVTAVNAVGRVDISSSNSSVVKVSPSSIFLDNDTQKITVTAVGEGTATIRVHVVDASTYDEEVLKNIYALNVTVKNTSVPVEDPEPEPAPEPVVNPSTPSAPSNQENISQTTEANTTPASPVTAGEEAKSGNVNLKAVTVNGLQATTADHIHYSISVGSSAETVKINAMTEDNKATITGIGDKKINVGTNQFPIVVTAEDGTIKNYTLTITKNSDYYEVDDIDEALSVKTADVILKVNEGTSLNQTTISKIQKSGKVVHLNKYTEDNDLEYSIIVDGNKIKDGDEIKTDLVYTFDDKAEFDEKVGHQDGVYLDFQTSNLPSGSKFRINLSDKYKDGDLLNVYTYDKKTLKLTQKAIQLKNGILEMDLDSAGKYFITNANIETSAGNLQSISYRTYGIIGVIGLFLIGLVIFFIIKDKKKKKQNAPVIQANPNSNPGVGNQSLE